MENHCPKYTLASVAFVISTLCLGGVALALDYEGSQISRNKPVMLTAQAMGYDERSSTAVAVGNVEVVQGDTILLADRVTYNQNTDVVHATGHVSILQPDGDVLFSDDAELKQSLEKGVAKEFRARLKDNSMFAAREAKKINKNVTELKDAVYSPCHVCAQKTGEDPKAPLWQMTAEKVTIDEEAQEVKYRNAFVDVYGVPVMYTPYFSHPTPDAPSESGLLMPQYYHSTTLGNVVKEPVYVSLKPNMDMTLTPWYMSSERPLLQGEFRHLTEYGAYEIRGAVTNAYDRDPAGNIESGTEMRDYIDVHGRMSISDHWNSGIDAERTSDNTFLALYGIGWQDMLTSRLYAERIEDRNYAVVESLAFQGLQPQDVVNQSPYILPQANVHFESDPLASNSRIILDGNALALERQQGDSDQRLSSTVGWKLPYITKGGQVIEAKMSVRGDAYNVVNQTVNSTTGATFSGATGRAIPEADLDWRYPFINRFGESTSLMIAPIAEFAASPNLHTSSNIPNEDSRIAELSDINLFSSNRFTGLDKLESGLRGTYGMRGQLQFSDDKYVEWLLGQAYQQNTASPFPLANAISEHSSDYIGRFALRYKGLDAAYSFRLDRTRLTPVSNEVTTGINFSPVSLNASYISLHNEPLFGDRKEVFGNSTVDLTKTWQWTLAGRRDLGSSATTSTAIATNAAALNLLTPTNGTVGLSTGLVFHNECLVVSGGVGRSYITVQDVKPATTVSVMVILKNFGSPDTTAMQSPAYTEPGTEKMTTVPGTSNMSQPGVPGVPAKDIPGSMVEQQLFSPPPPNSPPAN